MQIKSLNGFTDGDGNAKVVGFIENDDSRPLMMQLLKLQCMTAIT